MPLDGTRPRQHRRRRRRCAAEGVAAIVVLGGDGTHRVVAKACGDIPLCALSTGTNNAFPELREATVAGLATGLVATGRAATALRRETALEVTHERRHDLALVDVAVSRERFVGARALWRPEHVTELLVTFANPSRRRPLGDRRRAAPVRPRRRARAPRPRSAPRARDSTRRRSRPGSSPAVGVAAHRALALGEAVALARRARSRSTASARSSARRRARDRARSSHGPSTIDVDAVMAQATRDATPAGVASAGDRRPRRRARVSSSAPERGGTDQGAAARGLPRDAHHPRVRGAPAPRVRDGRDPRLRAPVRGRGGDRGRHLRPPRRRRLRRQHAPRPRPRDRQGLRRQGR